MANKTKVRTDEILRYDAMVKKAASGGNAVGPILRAFCVGGFICVIGQALRDAGQGLWGLSQRDAGTFSSVVLVLLTALLTGLGVFDRIGRFAGAGTFVPITGFANAVVAPAMEFRREGIVLGMGAKMFSVAGPVLVWGVTAAVLYGLILWLKTALFGA